MTPCPRAITGLSLCILLAACAPAVDTTTETGGSASSAMSSTAASGISSSTSSASTASVMSSHSAEAFDRDPCLLWAGAFGWFDPSFPDGVGVSALDLYLKLCPGHKTAERSKSAFCAKLKAGLQPGDPVMMAQLLCGTDLCADLRVQYCATTPSDQSAWVQDYADKQGCTDTGNWAAACGK